MMRARPAAAVRASLERVISRPGVPLQVRAHVRRTHGALEAEHLQVHCDAGLQGWMPLSIMKAHQQPGKLPTVIFLHATGASKEMMRERMGRAASLGFLAAAIDCRYHGERALRGATSPYEGYQEALGRAWRGSGEHPFLLDNLWDLRVLVDYLAGRPDVDAARIGCTGVSLGGMHTWLLAALEPRIACVAPLIGVQSFGWAVQHDAFHARVGSIPAVFAAAAVDLGLSSVTAEVVRAVWDKLLPGLLTEYDSLWSLPAIAPRPLLVGNGALDPRCPIAGLEAPLAAAREAYAACGGPEHLQVLLAEGVGHAVSPEMEAAVEAFFCKWLLGTNEAA
ncbi:hypothetical protein WJX81_003405 [Elliptochloris bilobata]|uniref:Dienelactone hydrolase domain-containing protein n=1 Tax=Elliptochloris bilobata TaxID=381761 RepID=A0AAW1S5D6_9CHLO